MYPIGAVGYSYPTRGPIGHQTLEISVFEQPAAQTLTYHHPPFLRHCPLIPAAENTCLPNLFPQGKTRPQASKTVFETIANVSGTIATAIGTIATALATWANPFFRPKPFLWYHQHPIKPTPTD